MSHSATAARLVGQLSNLRERCATLAEHLADASRELEATGAVPAVGLVDELDLVRSEFADIRRQTVDLAAAVDGRNPLPTDVASLSALDTALRSIHDAVRRQAAAEAKQQALLTLERVAQLRHRDDPEFQPLQQCQAWADELRHAISGVEWPQTHPDLASLADGSHALAKLVEFVAQQAELDDARWELLHDAVATSLGRPLAVAAARGKLVSVRRWADQDDVQRSADQDDEDAWPTVSISAPEADRPVGPLVWKALLKNRPSLAFLSLTCLDEGSQGSTNVPIWLLRALALSAHVSYPNGDIAHQLAEDFGSYDGLQVAAAGEALCLLVAAATLRPALVAPDTGAWAVLRTLVAADGLPNFQHYVQCIAEYGERNPALAPQTLSDELSPVAWRDRMEDLLRDVGAWRVRFLGMRSSYAPAREVWQSWLRPDGLIHTLLDPLTLDPRGLEAVRGQVERLSNVGQIRWEIADTDRRLLGRLSGPDIAIRRDALEQLSERVRESVVFARRWIALQERRPHRLEDEPRRAGLRLKQQLADLRPAIVQELTDRQVAARGLPLQAALVQCQAAIANVGALLENTESDIRCLQEPPAPMILYGDLLRIRGSWIDRDWQPRSRPAAHDLNGLIDTDELPDWRTTFEQHRQAKDHLATAQVIQFLEMQGADSHELQAEQAEDVQHCRAALRRDVELTRDQVDAAAAAGRLTEQARARLLAVLERIAAALGSTVRFEPEHHRLRQLRDQLESLGASPGVAEARWREAGPLLLRSLGDARPESSAVVARAISLANYESDAIQQLATLLTQRAPGALVTRAALEAVASSHDGTQLLTANLRATLQSNPHQLIVLYSLALAYWSPRYDDTDVAADGVTSAWLAEHARQWCPNALSRVSADDLAHVVADMLAVGLLRSVAQDRLILGNPTLLPYLGSEEELMSTLLDYDKGEWIVMPRSVS